jgi:hypothetical protein
MKITIIRPGFERCGSGSVSVGQYPELTGILCSINNSINIGDGHA